MQSPATAASSHKPVVGSRLNSMGILWRRGVSLNLTILNYLVFVATASRWGLMYKIHLKKQISQGVTIIDRRALARHGRVKTALNSKRDND